MDHHVTVVPAVAYHARCEPCEMELETTHAEGLRAFIRDHGGRAEYIAGWDIGDDEFDPAIALRSEFSSLTDD